MILNGVKTLREVKISEPAIAAGYLVCIVLLSFIILSLILICVVTQILRHKHPEKFKIPKPHVMVSMDNKMDSLIFKDEELDDNFEPVTKLKFSVNNYPVSSSIDSFDALNHRNENHLNPLTEPFYKFTWENHEENADPALNLPDEYEKFPRNNLEDKVLLKHLTTLQSVVLSLDDDALSEENFGSSILNYLKANKFLLKSIADFDELKLESKEISNSNKNKNEALEDAEYVGYKPFVTEVINEEDLSHLKKKLEKAILKIPIDDEAPNYVQNTNLADNSLRENLKIFLNSIGLDSNQSATCKMGECSNIKNNNYNNQENAELPWKTQCLNSKEQEDINCTASHHSEVYSSLEMESNNKNMQKNAKTIAFENISRGFSHGSMIPV